MVLGIFFKIKKHTHTRVAVGIIFSLRLPTLILVTEFLGNDAEMFILSILSLALGTLVEDVSAGVTDVVVIMKGTVLIVSQA